MNQDQFSEGIQQAYMEALKGADAITANAELIRREVEKELEAAREARRTAEAEGERLVGEYFEKARAQLMETAITERLRQLTRAHLEAGKTSTDICAWLGVDEAFVEAIRKVHERTTAIRVGSPGVRRPDGNPTLRYENSGRGGTVWYEDGNATFDMWWEFAGGDALVIVDIPTPAQWEARTKLPLEARATVLTFVGHQLIAERNAGNGSFLIGENVLTIYGR